MPQPRPPRGRQRGNTAARRACPRCSRDGNRTRRDGTALARYPPRSGFCGRPSQPASRPAHRSCAARALLRFRFRSDRKLILPDQSIGSLPALPCGIHTRRRGREKACQARESGTRTERKRAGKWAGKWARCGQATCAAGACWGITAASRKTISSGTHKSVNKFLREVFRASPQHFYGVATGHRHADEAQGRTRVYAAQVVEPKTSAGIIF